MDQKIFIENIDFKKWKESFTKETKSLYEEMKKDWDSNWEIKCNGKHLIEQICRKYSIHRERRDLKKDLVRHNREQQTAEWKKVSELLSKVLTVSV